MMTKEVSTKIVNFMFPCAGGSCARVWSYTENALFLLESSFLTSGTDQTDRGYSNDYKGRVYPNCNVHDPQCRGLCASHVSPIVKIHYSCQ